MHPLRGFNGAGRFHARKGASHVERKRIVSRLQWGRAFSRPEGRRRLSTAWPMSWLQWGRAFSRPEGTEDGTLELAAEMLQWGRAFSRPEGVPSRPP